MWLLLLPFRFLGQLFRFLRTVWKFASVLIIVFLIALNAATLTFDVANRMLSSFVDAVAGSVSLRSKAEAKLAESVSRVAELEADVDRRQARIVDLDEKINRQNVDLTEVRKERARLLGEIDNVTADLNAERDRQLKLRERLRVAEVDLASERELGRKGSIDLERERARRASTINDLDKRTRQVVTRSGNMLAREVSSMPLEAVPWLGIATIVGTTAWEANDLCATARDMQAIRTSLGISDPLATGTNEICGVEIPSVEELWARIISGKDAEIGVRCRTIRELGRQVPEECPDKPNLPPLPDTGPTEVDKPGPLPSYDDDSQSTDSQTRPGPLLREE